MKVRSMAVIAEKWGRVTAERAVDYAAGVSEPKKDWQSMALASAPNWTAGVQAAISTGAFAKGVGRTTTQNWKDKTLSKGPGRFAEGVLGAKPEYERGFEPYRKVLEGLTLPPRSTKGSAANYARVKAVGDALRAEKLRK